MHLVQMRLQQAGDLGASQIVDADIHVASSSIEFVGAAHLWGRRKPRQRLFEKRRGLRRSHKTTAVGWVI
jgi:hypothetical protein